MSFEKAIVKQRGFTLIEVLLVLTVAGLLAGAATLRLTRSLQTHSMDDIIDQIRQMDQLARTRAIRSGQPLRLRIDLEAQSLSLNDAVEKEKPWSAVQFGSVKLIAAQGPAGSLQEIYYSSSGLSQSFAVELGNARGERRFILVTGLSGECVVLKDAKELQELLAVEKISHDAG